MNNYAMCAFQFVLSLRPFNRSSVDGRGVFARELASFAYKNGNAGQQRAKTGKVK
jgi:hypothetical protein